MARRASAATLDLVHRHFPWLAEREAAHLARIEASPRPSADGAAILMGHDLWIEPLVQYREELEKSADAPPPLWRFPFRPSAAWDSKRWLALPMEARVVRARAGSLAHRIETRFDAQMLEMKAQDFSSGLSALTVAGFATRDPRALEPLASEDELRTDVSIVELIVHWLRMVDHGERVLRDSLGSEFDVCGYNGACARCRSRWGTRERAASSVPPFHPGCRCFAQPRFTQA